MKRTLKIIFLFLSVMAIAAWLFKINEIRQYIGIPSDVFVYTLFLFEDTTTFSQKYSESKFKMLRIGETMEQVKATLGEPVSSNSYDKGEVWFYSKGAVDR
ncbi:MAG: outer membrane protein assembly factor BamE, partial [Candidatus Electryonea clarkiae]|nr:outer membrane protein assembly factor BamE [Candidatus Electryonea clarkiae]